MACGPALAQSPAETVAPAVAEFPVVLADKAVLNRLRKGGWVLYMRHGNTDNNIPDQPDLKLSDCSTQRPLNAEGRAVAARVGKAVAKAGIPVGEVWSSPLCRARETTALAFGEHFKVDENLMYTAHLTTQQKQPVLERTRQLLSQPVPAGTNRVLVAHAPNMADLIGYFVKPEGTVLVLQPLGNQQFRYVASIPPDLWAQLLH
jgi:phosphohistidine phosphatase SixA